jgi:hypothetical protein
MLWGELRFRISSITPDESTPLSSDRRAQRGSRFEGLGEDLNKEGTLFASSAETGALGDERPRRLLRDR